jgi:nitrite reductase/ring-hydroxylating ferredoxin subunit
MAGNERLICDSDALADGCGVRFEMAWGTGSLSAFAIRFRGAVHAYLNNCPHQGTELDWQPGAFFDDFKVYLICATHGAVFFPDSGFCCAGPCKGQKLVRIDVHEQDGKIYYRESA